MIALTRLKGQSIALNPDLIATVDAAPDTVVHLVNGDSIVVQESIDEIIHRVVAFRRLLVAAYATDPTQSHGHHPGAIHHAAAEAAPEGEE